jgi:CheY-like chemotaxis protein
MPAPSKEDEKRIRVGAGVRILVADDDPEMRDLLMMVLERQGHDVTGAHDGEVLLERLEGAASHELPQLVISDLQMPGRSGLDVLTGIRSAGLELPFILLTAARDQGTRPRWPRGIGWPS